MEQSFEITNKLEALAAANYHQQVEDRINKLIHELLPEYEEVISYHWISKINYNKLTFELSLCFDVPGGIYTYVLPITYLYKDLKWCAADWIMRNEILEELENKTND